MKSNMELPSAMRTAFAVCSALAAILQTLAVLISYDPTANYFERGAILPTLAVCLAIAGIVCGTIAARMTNTETLNDSPFSKQIAIPYAAIGFLLTAIVLPLNASAERMTLTLVTSVFLVLAAFFHILSCFPSIREKYATVICFLGFAAIVGCILSMGYFYFDVSVEMNAPLKVAVQMGLITAMLGYVGELRYLLGQPMPRTYLTVLSWSISVGALSAIAVPIAMIAKKLPRVDYAVGGLLVLCIATTQILRMRTLLSTPSTEDTATDNDADGKDLT